MPATVSATVAEQVIDALAFNDAGLIPAIAQDAASGEVLMLAWMSPEAVMETLTTGNVCYYSRSRHALWRKGETSGHRQMLVDFSYDCDSDAILLKVEQIGPACHTNRRSCFFHQAENSGITVTSEPLPS